MLSQHHNMVHGGLLGSRILLHIIVLANLDVGLKDCCKGEINASKKFYRELNPIFKNMPSDNLRIQSCKPGGPWPRSTGTCGLGDGKVCQA